MKEYIVALDQGTTSSRAIVFDRKGTIISKAQREFRQIYPKPGWVEHDPEDIWETQIDVMRKAIAAAGIGVADVAAIGITNQRETTIIWDRKTGKPIYNAVVWQCRRTADLCDKLKERGLENRIYAKTGLPIDAYFSGSKIKWILDAVPQARERAAAGELCFGTVDSFLMFRLSGGVVHATDYTNASRTMIFNIHDLCWDRELCEELEIPTEILPEVKPSGGLFGNTDPAVTDGAAIPIGGVAGDQQAAMFGHLCVKAGECKNTYGTGCFTLMNTGTKAVASHRGLITTLAASTEDGKPQYVLEGSVFVGGAVLQWLRDELHMIEHAKDADVISTACTDTGGVYLVPAFVGLGAPHWDSEARGMIYGITRGTKTEHIVRAALESIAFQVFDVVHAMEDDVNMRISALNVDGGASVSDVLMQFQSDLLQAEVVRPQVIETTALGACYLAGITAGIWNNTEEIKRRTGADKIFNPIMDAEERKSRLIGWEENIARAKYR